MPMIRYRSKTTAQEIATASAEMYKVPYAVFRLPDEDWACCSKKYLEEHPEISYRLVEYILPQNGSLNTCGLCGDESHMPLWEYEERWNCLCGPCLELVTNLAVCQTGQEYQKLRNQPMFAKFLERVVLGPNGRMPESTSGH